LSYDSIDDRYANVLLGKRLSQQLQRRLIENGIRRQEVDLLTAGIIPHPDLIIIRRTGGIWLRPALSGTELPARPVREQDGQEEGVSARGGPSVAWVRGTVRSSTRPPTRVLM
jgi:hypothetical protein